MNDLDSVKEHSYKSPSSEELFFRTVYNFSHTGEVLPGKFDREVESFPFRRHVLKPSEFSNEILPHKKVMEEVSLRLEEDKKKVNSLLVKKRPARFD
ncbi:hypothetical protein [Halomonas sp. KX33721]|uniref:hypothetical protein n=1 Tax=Halomonas sp. KX33721 TaxID=1819251 RepID=UPI000A408F30|nr:hypothetical protein [Halomonas sp. KX33721]